MSKQHRRSRIIITQKQQIEEANNANKVSTENLGLAEETLRITKLRYETGLALVSDLLDENDFSGDYHKMIYQGILRFVSNAQDFDANVLANYLQGKGILMDNKNTIDSSVSQIVE